MTLGLLVVTIIVAIACITALLAVMIIFGAAKPSPAAVLDFPANGTAGLPAIQTITARDGAALAFRCYPGNGSRVAILIHGTADGGGGMHGPAEALKSRGVTAYALDIRGHGASGKRGDIGYIGQLDDDLADFMKEIGRRHPGTEVVLVGFSSGGGFALRVAAGPVGALFDRFVLISPYLGHRAPTQRPHHVDWLVPYIPRLIALSILERLGIHRFEGLPAVAFAADPGARHGPMLTNSYRLSRNFHPSDDFRGDFRRVGKPMTVMVGGEDEVFYAERFADVIHGVRSDIAVKVVPGLGHFDMTLSRAGADAIAEEVAPAAAAR